MTRTKTRALANWPNNAVSVLDYGADPTGVAESHVQIQEAIDQNDYVYIPAGNYKCNGQIKITSHKNVCGSIPETNSSTGGTVLNFYDSTDSRCILLAGTGFRLENVRIINLNDANPMDAGVECNSAVTGTACYAYQLNYVFLDGNFDKAFHLQDNWNYTLNGCRVEGFRHNYGYYIDEGTSSTLNSCLSYGAKTWGFFVSGLFYSTFNGCGTDGGLGGIKFNGNNRGLTVNSFGAEGMSGTDIWVEGSNTSIVINAPTLGASNVSVDDDLIHIDGAAGTELAVTFVGLKLPSAYEPSGTGLSLKIDDSVATPKVTLINPVIFASSDTQAEIQKCTVIGGNQPNRLADLTVSGLTVSGTSPIVELSETDNTDQNFRLAVSSGRFYVQEFNDDNSVKANRVKVDNNGYFSIASPTGSGETLVLDPSKNSLSLNGNGTTAIRWVHGSGDPNGAVVAAVGSIYSRTDGGAGTSLYIKESGTSTSGWAAI